MNENLNQSNQRFISRRSLYIQPVKERTSQQWFEFTERVLDLISESSWQRDQHTWNFFYKVDEDEAAQGWRWSVIFTSHRLFPFSLWTTSNSVFPLSPLQYPTLVRTSAATSASSGLVDTPAPAHRGRLRCSLTPMNVTQVRSSLSASAALTPKCWLLCCISFCIC